MENQLVAIPEVVTSLVETTAFDVSYNHLSSDTMSNDLIEYINNRNPNWQSSQTIENDSLLSAVHTTPASGYQTTGQKMVLTASYGQ